ncbi:MAG: A/G-specific adenine glycosylase [Chromatiales bacterium]|nr:A/G-specific adenine glycosylase [Chromatiales bacterium]
MTGPAAAQRARFRRQLLGWFERHGRQDLPWQHPRTAYRVWVSEVMLQQTRVETVLPYFQRFMLRFPDVGTLASASLDQVLGLWSGLGYYARARNLHRSAGEIVAQHEGEFPDDPALLERLPGIGRSTAAAIVALAYERPAAILDGNVKRVLARVFGVEGWPGNPAIAGRLWDLSESLVPRKRVADYTQALMDLGATCCTRTRPDCGACPFTGDCKAARDGLTSRLPTPRPARVRPERSGDFLIVRDRHGRVLLERRPPRGVWGGLWTLPELPAGTTAQMWCRSSLGETPRELLQWPELRHEFTHFSLVIRPMLLRVDAPSGRCMEAPDRLWYKPGTPAPGGMPAPVSALLQGLQRIHEPEVAR